jgi:hypothetical protein
MPAGDALAIATPLTVQAALFGFITFFLMQQLCLAVVLHAVCVPHACRRCAGHCDAADS